MAINCPRMEDLDLKVKRYIGIKQYRETKKFMDDFNIRLQQEILKAAKVDQKIK